MKVISIATQKGGVGKTTTAHALSVGLAELGQKVLAVDIDPQANLTTACGATNYNVFTTYELLIQKVKTQEVIQSVSDKLDIIPSNIMLAGAEQELSCTGKEHRLKEMLNIVSDNYDTIIIDTPPNLGILTVNAFTASDEVIIPTTAGLFATMGINQLYETIKGVKKYCNANIEIRGILFTKFNPNTNISKQIRDLTEQLGEHLDIQIFDTFIRQAVAVEEAQFNKQDIFAYAQKSTVSEDYKAFVTEFLDRRG